MAFNRLLFIRLHPSHLNYLWWKLQLHSRNLLLSLWYLPRWNSSPIWENIYNDVTGAYVGLVEIGIMTIPARWEAILTTRVWIILIDGINTFIYSSSAIVVVIEFDYIFYANSKTNRSFIPLYFIYLECDCSIDRIERILCKAYRISTSSTRSNQRITRVRDLIITLLPLLLIEFELKLLGFCYWEIIESSIDAIEGCFTQFVWFWDFLDVELSADVN